MNKPFLLLALLGTTATAAVSFTHGDWQINCDNTHTCRVAGYQTDDGEKAPVSVLLTRAAGADAPISGKISLLTADESPLPDHITFTLDGKNLGELHPDKNNGEAELNAAQIEALLAALQAPRADIQFSGGKTQWQLSAAGASAVLLKWDEAQGRLQTASAVTLKQRGKKAVTVAPAAQAGAQSSKHPARQTDTYCARYRRLRPPQQTAGSENRMPHQRQQRRSRILQRRGKNTGGLRTGCPAQTGGQTLLARPLQRNLLLRPL
ncbi:DUF1176 domain-containing protein [Cardiobacterium valvarum]|uniref:DUF1176 domain-containing protein n=1 Tax=Cardiobacterium valvarum TaxID=194702 RepID=UPI0035E6CB0F